MRPEPGREQGGVVAAATGIDARRVDASCSLEVTSRSATSGEGPGLVRIETAERGELGVGDVLRAPDGLPDYSSRSKTFVTVSQCLV